MLILVEFVGVSTSRIAPLLKLGVFRVWPIAVVSGLLLGAFT